MIDVRFGRGVLPVIVRELTVASLEIDLTASADVLKQCPAVTVQAGVTFECTITVSSPDPGNSPNLTRMATDVVHTGGVGDWGCEPMTCAATTMPVGTATFAATGTLPVTATPGTMLNQIDVVWANDVFGPDHPAVAGAAIEVVGTSVVTVPSSAPPTNVPSRLAFTG